MIRKEYFKWMCEVIYSTKRQSYTRLLKYLYNVEFTYTISLDENRAEDGIDLRQRFVYESGTLYSNYEVQKSMGNDPCNMLEMLVALSVRCEEHIMEEIELGDRTSQWFWTMLDNSNLSSLTNNVFTLQKADHILNNVLNRNYSAHGEGGFFYVENPKKDLREVELWFQLCWYLDEYILNQERYKDL